DRHSSAAIATATVNARCGESHDWLVTVLPLGSTTSGGLSWIRSRIRDSAPAELSPAGPAGLYSGHVPPVVSTMDRSRSLPSGEVAATSDREIALICTPAAVAMSLTDCSVNSDRRSSAGERNWL